MTNSEKEYLKAVGERIRHLRKPLITQEELAEKIETKHTQIGRIERGEANCTLTTLRKIALVLNTTVSDLLNIAETERTK